MWAKRLKDKNFRSGIKKNEERNLSMHFLLRHYRLEGGAKVLILKRFQRRNRRGFLTQLKSRCILSLRSRSPLKFFRLSRIFFRTAASSGLLLGVKKSSW